MTKKTTVTVEYYRLWDDYRWDTDFIDIPREIAEGDDDAAINAAIQDAAWQLQWPHGSPVIVGLYSLGDELEEDDELDRDDQEELR